MLYILGIGTRAAAFQAIEIPQDLRWRAVELEIILREAGNCLQPVEVVQGEPPVFERNQFVAPESLENAVGVHRGQTEHVGQIRLGKWIDLLANPRFAPDSPMEETGFEPCMGLFLSSGGFGLLAVLCSERESRSSSRRLRSGSRSARKGSRDRNASRA
jgi:hypothetical protein